MSYEDFSPRGLVELLGERRWEDLTIEQAGAVDHALRQYQQSIYALDEALEVRVRRIVAGPAPAEVSAPIFTVFSGRLLRLK